MASSTQYSEQELENLTYDAGSGGKKFTQVTGLTPSADGVLTYPRGSNYTNLSASGQATPNPGKFTGIFVASASATPTIKVWDNTSAATTILVNTFTPAAATYYSFPNVRVNIGIYVTITGTVDCTVFYDPTTA